MEKKTKPFVIATVAVPGGGRLGIAPLPGRGNSLAEDLAIILDWKPALVVSMTETEEMEQAGAAGLAGALAGSGIAWRHFLVPDYSAPDLEDQRWPALSAEVHGLFDTGESLLLHCHGGKGRSGMVAVRLLVERGLPAVDALAVVRAARPGAVETAAQEEWAADGVRTRRRS